MTDITPPKLQITGTTISKPAISRSLFLITITALAGLAMPGTQAIAAEPAAIVEMTDAFKFKPEKITVKAGDTVEWKNSSQVFHTVTADPDKAQDEANVKLPEGAEPFDSGNIQPEESYQHTFEVAGEYRYFCIPHEMMGMTGEITVEPAQ